jgi:hypothetical protein
MKIKQMTQSNKRKLMLFVIPITLTFVFVTSVGALSYVSAGADCPFETITYDPSGCVSSVVCLAQIEIRYRAIYTYRAMRTPWYCPWCTPTCTVIDTVYGDWLFMGCCQYAREPYAAGLEIFITTRDSGETFLLTAQIPTCARRTMRM